MPRITHRLIERRFNKRGEEICLVPPCTKPADRYKNGKPKNYCSGHGYQDMLPFVNWEYLKEKIFRRDNYTCVKCGDNRRNIQVMRREKRWLGASSDYMLVKTTISNLEADHIKEVADGGSFWDPKNIQTLCHEDHKNKTRHFNRFRNSTKALEKGTQKTLEELNAP
jgi:5-methylcytosine-specific restriction endonuclease McrA